MNFEKMNELSQKVEGVLGTVRNLKEENASLRQQLVDAQAAVQDKTTLLETANANLAACQAALNEQECQTKSQTQSLNTKDLEIEDLRVKLEGCVKESEDLKETISQQENQIREKNEKLSQSAALLQESAERIREYEAKRAENEEALRASQSQVQELAGKLNEREEELCRVNAEKDEKQASIAELTETVNALKSEIEQKNGSIDSLNVQLQAQADEIADAQEKFNNLLATIENELGTELPVERLEPVVDDLPTIEVHGADENTDKPSAGQGGRQTSFFD